MHTREQGQCAWEEQNLIHGIGGLIEALEVRCSKLRPAHPVSVLDVSPDQAPSLEIARWLRSLGRKSHLMSLEWPALHKRPAFTGHADIMVGKGALPGMHFSPHSFDYVVGVAVLSSFVPEVHLEIVHELRLTALRGVVLYERGAADHAHLTRLVQPFQGQTSLLDLEGGCLITID